MGFFRGFSIGIELEHKLFGLGHLLNYSDIACHKLCMFNNFP